QTMGELGSQSFPLASCPQIGLTL
ncbi:hypothetical protein D030_4765B, partial [Vibrio parahaemolyticus AQ3810]